MKIRLGFVSNSSSSSFVIIDASRGYDSLEGTTLNIGPGLGDAEFGWGPEKVEGIGARINFAYLQANYAEPIIDPLLEKAKKVVYGHSNEYFAMLEEVIKENSHVQEIVSDFEKDKWGAFDNGYIDHQSSAREGKNMEIFESKEMLRDFIFGKASYIQLDNDNH